MPRNKRTLSIRNRLIYGVLGLVISLGVMPSPVLYAQAQSARMPCHRRIHRAMIFG